MTSRSVTIFMLIPVFLLFFTSGAKAQTGKEESVSPTHEMPKADNCSVIMMNIRQLAASRHDIVKERSRLEPPVRTDSMTNEQYEQALTEYENKRQQLDIETEELQEQIDEKEQQLDFCLENEKNQGK